MLNVEQGARLLSFGLNLNDQIRIVLRSCCFFPVKYLVSLYEFIGKFKETTINVPHECIENDDGEGEKSEFRITLCNVQCFFLSSKMVFRHTHFNVKLTPNQNAMFIDWTDSWFHWIGSNALTRGGYHPANRCAIICVVLCTAPTTVHMYTLHTHYACIDVLKHFSASRYVFWWGHSIA